MLKLHSFIFRSLKHLLFFFFFQSWDIPMAEKAETAVFRIWPWSKLSTSEKADTLLYWLAVYISLWVSNGTKGYITIRHIRHKTALRRQAHCKDLENLKSESKFIPLNPLPWEFSAASNTTVLSLRLLLSSATTLWPYSAWQQRQATEEGEKATFTYPISLYCCRQGMQGHRAVCLPNSCSWPTTPWRKGVNDISGVKKSYKKRTHRQEESSQVMRIYSSNIYHQGVFQLYGKCFQKVLSFNGVLCIFIRTLIHDTYTNTYIYMPIYYIYMTYVSIYTTSFVLVRQK